MLPAVSPALSWPRPGLTFLPRSNRNQFNPSIFLCHPLHPPQQYSNYQLYLSVHASVPSNTYALYGHGEEKELTELVPGILNQLGPDSLASLRKLAESYQNMQKAQGEKKDDDEDDIPDLVEGENFESKVE